MRSAHRGWFAGAALAVSCAALAPSARAVDGTWIDNTDTLWTNLAAWSGGAAYADGVGATAWFTNNITAHRTVTIDTNITLGTWIIADAVGGTAAQQRQRRVFNLAAGGSLTLDDTDGAVDIQMTSGSNHIINADFQINDNLTIQNTVTAIDRSMVINGVISDGGAGLSLTKTGGGGLILTRTNTFSGGLTVSGGTLFLQGGDDSLHTNGAITMSSGTLNMGGFSQSTDGAVTFIGGTSTNGTIVKSGGDYGAQGGTVALVLAGNVGLAKTGTGAINFDSNNTYAGNTLIDGGTLRLRNAGTLAGTTNIVVHDSVLEINNFAVNQPGRINDAATLVSQSATIRFTNDAGSSAYSETLDRLELRSGNALVQLTPAAGGGSSAMVFSNATSALTRSGGATARIEAPGLGANAQNELLLASAPEVKNGIVPWLLVKDGIGGFSSDYNLATTNTGSGGLLGIAPLPGLSYDTGLESGWAATGNARPPSDQALSANRSLNALVLDDGLDIRGDAGAQADRILDFSGAGGAALIVQTGGNSLIDPGAFSPSTNDVILNFGNNQGIFNTIGTLTINRANSNEQIRGTNGFVKTGPGTLVIDGANQKSQADAQAMGGDFYINEGTLELRRAGSGGGTRLVLDGGTLRLASGADANYGNDLFVNESGSVVVAHTNASTVALDMTLSNVTIAAGRTLTINRDAANFSAANQAYRVVARDVGILGDATIDVRTGKGTGDGTFTVDSVSDGGSNYNLAVIGNNVIRSQLIVNNTMAVSNLTIGNNALVRLNDGATNVLGNVDLFGGLLGLNLDFARELGEDPGQVQLTGDAGLQAGFSAFGAPVRIRIEDGVGGLTNLVWGAAPTFNPGILTLQQDDADAQLTFENSLDLNAAVSNLVRQINVHADVAIIGGTITNSGPFVADFVKGGAGTLWLTNGFHWNGATRISGGILRIPDPTNLPTGNLLLNPANAVGVLESTGLMTRALGTNANEISIVGGGNAGQNSRSGFSAFGGDLTVDIGGDGTGTGTQLVWNSENFDPVGPSTNNGALLLNTANATGTLRLLNDMDLNGEAGLSSPVRRIEVNGSTAILSGDITNSQAGVNAIGLLKRGTGVLSLEGLNTYDGPTTVSAGTLLVNGAHTGGAAFDVLGGAALGGTGLIGAPILVNSNAVIAPGNFGIGTLNVQGDVDIEGILAIEVDASGGGFVDLLTVTGILDISLATLGFATNGITLDDTAYIFATYGSLVTNGISGGFLDIPLLPDGYQIDYNYLGGNQIALVIPEPTTWALMIVGGLALLAARRRRS